MIHHAHPTTRRTNPMNRSPNNELRINYTAVRTQQYNKEKNIPRVKSLSPAMVLVKLKEPGRSIPTTGGGSLTTRHPRPPPLTEPLPLSAPLPARPALCPPPAHFPRCTIFVSRSCSEPPPLPTPTAVDPWYLCPPPALLHPFLLPPTLSGNAAAVTVACGAVFPTDRWYQE